MGNIMFLKLKYSKLAFLWGIQIATTWLEVKYQVIQRFKEKKPHSSVSKYKGSEVGMCFL